MKKLIVLLMIVGIALSLFGCKSSDYKKAMDLYESGEYEEAWKIFDTLVDYEDSETWSKKARYEMAVELWEEKKFDEACALFELLEDYKDSAKYLEKKGRSVFFAYLTEKGSLQETDGDAEYSISFIDSVLTIQYKMESSGMGFLYALGITEDGTCVLHGKGTIAVGQARLEDSGNLAVDMASYVMDSELEWFEYDASGTKVDGTPVDEDAVGLVSNPSKSMTKVMNYLAGCLEESGTGLTLRDLGFLNCNEN